MTLSQSATEEHQDMTRKIKNLEILFDQLKTYEKKYLSQIAENDLNLKSLKTTQEQRDAFRLKSESIEKEIQNHEVDEKSKPRSEQE